MDIYGFIILLDLLYTMIGTTVSCFSFIKSFDHMTAPFIFLMLMFSLINISIAVTYSDYPRGAQKEVRANSISFAADFQSKIYLYGIQ